MKSVSLFSQVVCLLSLLVGSALLDDTPFKCKKCDLTDPSCTRWDKEIESVVCDSNKCYTLLKDKMNERGCWKDDNEALKDCSPENKDCQLCDKSECNDQPLPANRSKCHKCSKTEECRLNKNIKDSYCDEPNGSGCFAYYDGLQTIRDCLSDDVAGYKDACKVHKEYCKEGPKNDEVLKLECFTCFNTTGDCKRPKASSTKADCTIEKIEPEECASVDTDHNSCYTELNKLNIVKRGCILKSNATKSEAVASTRFGMQKCKGNKCNSACVADVRCHKCESEKDASCTAGSIKPEWLSDCNEYTSICHTCERPDKSTFRGCGNTMDGYCNFCVENNCTTPQRQCFNCNEGDTNCTNIDATTLTKSCKTGWCFAGLSANGFMVRGCTLEDKKCPEGLTDCKTCDSNECNTDLVPATRRLCFQCDESNQEWCKAPNASEKKAKACNKYVENDECYLYAHKKENKMVRGCWSDDPATNANRKGCAPNDTETSFGCVRCNTTNCNLTPFQKANSFKCIKCNDADSKCEHGFDKQAALDCDPTRYDKNETCFIHTDEKKINRGCTLDKDSEKFGCTDVKNAKCQVCAESACNAQKLAHQTCYRCRSDARPDCALKGVGKLKATECKNEQHTANLGCYTENYKNLIIRECVSELTKEEAEACSTSKKCDMCKGMDCNNNKPPNAARSIHAMSSLMLVVLIGCSLGLIF